jgi:copper resistance protein D
MHGMYAWFLISMWLHLLAAIVWIGGLAFVAMVLVPVLRGAQPRAQAIAVLRATGRKFMRVAYASLATLVVTGVANLYLKAGGSWAAVGGLWPTTYGRLLAAKLVLVALIVATSLCHDFVVGPAAARALERDAASAEAARLRAAASWLGRLNTLLSLVVMTLALLLVRGLPV